MFKKVFLGVMLISLMVFNSYAATSGNIAVSGTVASNLTLSVTSSAYTLVSTGVLVSAPATVSAMSIKSNAKTGFTITVASAHAANDSFNAIAETIGTAEGQATYWPYKLYLEDVVKANTVELTPTAPSKTYPRKTTAAGDSFNLKISYDSAENLNLDVGTYLDTISVTLTAN